MTSLIPIFITFLVCGALFIFFNARLAAVQGAVEKQNRVLTAFITNVQNDIRGANVMGANVMGGSYHFAGAGTDAGAGSCTQVSTSIGVNHLASEEAVKRCEKEKIVVSEDEDNSDDDSNSDSESSDDSDNESVVANDNDSEPVKIIKLQDSSLDNESSPVLNIDSYIESLPSEVDLKTDVESLLEDNLKVVNLDVTSDVKPEVDYEHMKVDDLRKIVSDKRLATKEEVKKLKKPELLAVLRETGG
jgi:hypothetical protein